MCRSRCVLGCSPSALNASLWTAATDGPLADVVLLATADPDITIYWQIDSNGG